MMFRDFNSIKVRLNRYSGFKFAKNIVKFQFHKGTIKPALVVGAVDALTYFNSIKVRLNHNNIRKWKQLRAFQFHKGTIKP